MDTLLVLTDFSVRAEHAAEYAVKIAKKTRSKVLLYHSLFEEYATPDVSGTLSYYDNIAVEQEESHQHLKKLKERLLKKLELSGEDADLEINSMAEPGSLASRVQHLLATEKIEMIIMGTKGPNELMDRLVFRSDTEDVIKRANCPILLVPEKTEFSPFKKIIFATDLSTSDHIALQFLKRMANVFDSEITILHVLTEETMHSDHEKKKKFFYDLKKQIDYYDINYVDIAGDNIPSSLAAFSRMEECDVLALTHHKRSFIQSLFHHSTTMEMVKYQDIPLLIFPERY